MRRRLGDIKAQGIAYGERITINGVEISFHPAGHIAGSSQIRLAYRNEVWVVSGDYKLTNDGLCTPFEPVQCSDFITESTFGLPVFNWLSQNDVMASINHWWAKNAAEGFNSVIFGYSLGKAQRILAHLEKSIGPVYVHGSVANMNDALTESGYDFKHAMRIYPHTEIKSIKGALIVAPPSAQGSPWLNKFKPLRTATASGWMSMRGARRRRNVDSGFVLSDHADWRELNEAVVLSGAGRVYVTHGYSSVFANWLSQKGITARVVKTEYEGELAEIGESQNKEPETE
jgi:putative mRNA 3-end processing factor